MPRRSRIDAPGAMHHVIVKIGDIACIVNFLAEEGRSSCSIQYFYLYPITAALIDHINPRPFGVFTSGVYDYGTMVLLFSLVAFVLLTIGLLAYVLRNPIE